MKAYVDENCTACGLCADICPQVFSMDDGDMATVIVDPIPEALQDSCQDAADSCPVEAIIIDL